MGEIIKKDIIMEKINIAEILKDCPNGMELDCTIFDDVHFDYIDDVSDIINCYIQDSTKKIGISFSKYGCYSNINKSKCVIFPKGKTTWEGFVPPCKFKDGDIIFVHTNALKCNLDNSWISIFKEYRNNRCACYMCLCLTDLELYHDKWEDELLCELCEMEESRLATKEEKDKLFKAIKDNGYKWNAETKTLEKLKKEKFDITTLKPFDKVLVRIFHKEEWKADFFSHYTKDADHPFVTVGKHALCYCIPYENNEHLLGKTDDCDEYYKTWE